ncbi:proteasome assembly chaperone family protein [Candidatus Woesearchaeota archaeon]|nr:proteasome assembly chaperone family protein [Candidatus Woesearchaeota archaeon]
MDYKLTKKPKECTIIQGFPSIGLVSTIATKFLIEHLTVEKIGSIHSNKILPIAAIHKGEIIEPISIYYNKKYNLIIIQALAEVTGFEWEMAETILKMAKELKAVEIITLEGTGTQQKKMNTFYYSNIPKRKIDPLERINEGAIMGVTAAIFLKADKFPITCLFVETNSGLPDSEAAAKIVKALDIYKNMKVNFKPLLETAKVFESNLRTHMEKSKEIMMQQRSRNTETNYIG